MRVLLASNFYPPVVVGGAEMVVASLARWLVASGHDVTVVTTCDATSRVTCSTQDGVRVIRYFPPNLWWNYERFRANNRHTALARALWNFRDLWNRKSGSIFGRFLDEVRPDLVHTHNIKGMSPAIWAQASKRGIPVVHTLHDYYLVCRSGVMTCAQQCISCRGYGLWQKRTSQSVAHFCAPSRYLLRRHLELGIGGSSGHSVVANGFPNEVAEHRQIRTANRFLFIGQLRVEKGAHLLTEIARRLDPDACLDVAGTGPLAGVFSEPRTGLTFHGFVEGEQKKCLLSGADALIFPSMWSENAPVVLTEAFQRGIPVIASDLGAIPEFVQDGVNGLLVKAGDTHAFAAAALRLIKEPDLYARLCNGARECAARYTDTTMGQCYRDIYQSLAGA